MPDTPYVVTIKQYEHALMHHVMFQLRKEKGFTIAAAGSSWLEAANKMWKHNLMECTSKGGGHKGGAIDQIQQVMRRACLGSDPAFATYLVQFKSYKCGMCGVKPKKGHMCTAELNKRAAAVAAMTGNVSTLPSSPARLPPLPNMVFSRPAQVVHISQPPQSPARVNMVLTPESAAQGSAAPHFHESPITDMLAMRVHASIQAVMPDVLSSSQRVPTAAQILEVANRARRCFDLEKALVERGGMLALLMIAQRVGTQLHYSYDSDHAGWQRGM